MRGKVHGYHRGLYLWSRVNRGTPERPGLVLALDRGGSCSGIAFRLSGPTAQPHLETLWKREMPMGSYRPAWLPCTLESGERVNALAFVMRRDVPTYTGKLSDTVVKEVFSCAAGRYGTTLDYVSRTVDALRASGIPDRALERVARAMQVTRSRTARAFERGATDETVTLVALQGRRAARRRERRLVRLRDPGLRRRRDQRSGRRRLLGRHALLSPPSASEPPFAPVFDRDRMRRIAADANRPAGRFPRCAAPSCPNLFFALLRLRPFLG